MDRIPLELVVRFTGSVTTPWRTLLWSLGTGAARLTCGVTRTSRGYRVDVQQGEMAVHDEVHPTRENAVRRALALEKKHRREPEPGTTATRYGRAREWARTRRRG